MSSHEQFYDKLPNYARNLKQFGRLGAVLNASKSTLKAKLKNRGIVKYFVGYAPTNALEVFRMYNPDTGRVSVTREKRWMDGLIGDDVSHKPATIIDDANNVNGDATDNHSIVSGESDANSNNDDYASDNDETDADTDDREMTAIVMMMMMMMVTQAIIMMMVWIDSVIQKLSQPQLMT